MYMDEEDNHFFLVFTNELVKSVGMNIRSMTSKYEEEPSNQVSKKLSSKVKMNRKGIACYLNFEFAFAIKEKIEEDDTDNTYEELDKIMRMEKKVKKKNLKNISKYKV